MAQQAEQNRWASGVPPERVLPLSLRDLLYSIFRHKRLFRALSLSIFAAMVAGLSIWPESYSATARVLVKLGRQNVDLGAVPSQTSTQVLAPGLRKEDLNSEIEILRNRLIIEEVVDRLGPDFLFPESEPPRELLPRIKFEIKRAASKLKEGVDEVFYFLDLKKRLPPRESAIAALESRLRAEHIRDSDVIEISLRWYGADIAKGVVESLLDLYLEHHLDSHRDPDRHQFLEGQVELIAVRLREAEERLQALKVAERFTEFNEERGLLLTHARQLEADLDQSDTAIAEAEKEVATLRALIEDQTPYVERTVEIDRNPRAETLRAELLSAELERMNASLLYLPESRPVRELEARVEQLKSRLAAEEADVTGKRTKALNELYLEAQKALLFQEAKLAALRGKQTAQEANRDKRWAQIRELDSNWIQIERLERQIQLDEENYLLYSKKLEEARIAGVLDSERIVSVKVIQPPLASLTPVRPRKMWIAGLGVLLALLVPLGAVLLLDYLDESMLKPEDVEDRLGLPVLASVRQA
jgi:uncharacterized protein involved in exopolysaccharide biosynthesis